MIFVVYIKQLIRFFHKNAYIMPNNVKIKPAKLKMTYRLFQLHWFTLCLFHFPTIVSANALDD